MSSYNFSEFTDEEIRDQLEYLGFKNVSQDKFSQFKKDLQKLILQEISMNSTASSFHDAQEDLESNHEPQVSTQASKNHKRVTFPSDSQMIVNSTPVQAGVQDETDEGNESMRSFVSTSSSIVDNKVIKRKIRRKVPVANRFDNEPDDSQLAAEFNTMKLSHRESDSQLNETLKNEEEISSSDTEHFNELATQSDDEQFVRVNNEYAPINFPLKSFIRTQSSLSLRSDVSRASVRSNPVQRYQAYQQAWSKHKAPGEKKHSDLRWSIREQMLVKHVIVKKQHKSYVPNTYVIPTEKKRQQLRWVIRSALANPS